MSNRFYISDLHFDHKNILTFKDNEGKPLRDFSSLDDMQATIVQRWNTTVTNKDTIYVLGDVVMGKSTKSLEFLEMLRGRKILIRGNHDIAKLAQYARYFADVRGCDVKPDFICSHIPIHPESVNRFKINVHGHLHANRLKDPRYINVCVEQIDYTPISYDAILQIKKLRGI